VSLRAEDEVMFVPGLVCEVSWSPPEGETFAQDAFTADVGTVTEFRYQHGLRKLTLPARILSAVVAEDGLSVTATIRLEQRDAPAK
jgi:hypothetical protein